MRLRIDDRRAAGAAILALFVSTGCAGAHLGGLLEYSHPADLVGVWADSAQTTAADTIAWVFGPRGSDETLTVRSGGDASGHSSVTREQGGYGYWYVAGPMDDPAHRQICFRYRGRGPNSCFAFTLDTIRTAAGATLRRLFIPQYRGQRHTRDRVLFAPTTPSSAH
jgi:hypothetical protein